MPLLSSAELTSMRAVHDGTLPDTCTVERATGTQTDIGEGVPSWATLASSVACRLAPNTEREQDLGMRSVAVGEWVLTVTHDQDLVAGDRVVVGARTFNVLGVTEGRSWGLCRRAALIEVRSG